MNDDHQVYAKIHVDVREYGTAADNQLAMSVLSELQSRICKYDKNIKDVLVQNLANITEVSHFIQEQYFVDNPLYSLLAFLFLFLKLHTDDLAMLLSETFKPDEDFVFGPQSTLDQNKMNLHCQDSLSFDGVCFLVFVYIKFMLFLNWSLCQ